MEWELIDEITRGHLPDPYSQRLKVPGGWIVRTVKSMHAGCSVNVVFIPDPGHEWTLEELKGR